MAFILPSFCILLVEQFHQKMANNFLPIFGLLFFAFPSNSLRPPRIPPIRFTLPLKMPPRRQNQPSIPSFSPPKMEFIVFTTIQNLTLPTLSTTMRNQMKLIRRESGQKGFNRVKNVQLLANISKQKEEEEKEKWTKLLINEMRLGLMLGNETGREEMDTEIWQLFSRCSGGFMAINGQNRVEAKKGQWSKLACNTHFVAESVSQGDWAFRGQILLKHIRTGLYICLGKRRGIMAKANPGRSKFCRFLDHLTPSGHSQFLSIRPLGFSPSGSPLTHPMSNNKFLRCFQFTKLVDSKGADCFGRKRRAKEREMEQQEQLNLREIARQTLLAKIEADESHLLNRLSNKDPPPPLLRPVEPPEPWDEDGQSQSVELVRPLPPPVLPQPPKELPPRPPPPNDGGQSQSEPLPPQLLVLPPLDGLVLPLPDEPPPLPVDPQPPPLCCICICQRGKKKARGTESRRTDRRWDWLRRLLLNGIIGLLVLANVFCAAILLLSTQYAQHGLDELPTRLHYCANDLLVYRSETNEQIRKLLRDDFTRFNQSLQNALDGTGQMVVQRLKEDTGVDQLENAVIRASNAPKLHSQFRQIHEELGGVLDARHSLQIRLLRLRQAREGLAECERIAKSGERAAICHQARQALLPILELAIGGDEPQADWEGEEKARELSSLLPDQPSFLSQIEQIDIERRFSAPLEGLQLLQHGIQTVVDSRRQDADERLRLLDRTLQSHYEQISSAVKSVDLRFLDEQILDPMMRQRERFRHFVQIGWLAALIISGLFAFLSLAFLLGLCFGCCGRRPSEYDEDDCCVRSTGANFFGCSIWLSLVLISVFGIISAVSMFIGANSAYLVCDPLRHPLDRPDILSLADRLVTLWGLDKPQSTSQKSFSQIFTSKRRPADLIQGCVQGKTLYSMFELDQKFTLLGEGGPMDEYEEMANSIRQSLISGRLLESAIGQSATSNSIQQNPQSAFSFGGRWNEFNAEMRNSLESLGQIQMIEWEEDSVKEFCSQRIRFQLEPILAELRRLKQSAEENEQQQTGQKGINDVPMEELDSVLRFLEDIRPETVQVRALLEQGCAHLEQLRTDVLSLNFNSTSLLADLDRIQRDFGSEHAMRQKLHSVAGEIAVELAGMVRQYGEHVNKSMNSEVSNCSSLAEIAKNTGAAICDYGLDPLNSLWLALGLGLFLLIPIILLASALNPLYHRTNSYPKYIVPSSISADCPNEARFATDIYGLAPASNCYGTSATLKANNHNNSAGYQQPINNNLCTQITSPYATSNYGYQELCPPIYMGTSRR